ncbi:MAG: Lytic transglycosylase catalytic [Gemmatimonadetes bacterium]|nr:Lytic transglycosylase catalytic [Gemmatimonadota bacterium]
MPGDRRQHSERREGPQPSAAAGGRRGKRGTSPLGYLLRAIGAVVVLVAVIVVTLRGMNPVFATKGKLGDELRRRVPGAAEAIGAGDSTNVDRLMASAKFLEEKRNFYEDVMRLKQVDSARADSIATFAVREAYVRGISPAIIFGVMLTENSRFISKAQSNVGAVGLMQIYPKVWLTKEMTRLFGRDLVSDSTNVKYGVFILQHYFNPKDRKGNVRERDWQTALLRYNGCVRGTNTPRCHTYPNKVQSFVENQATSICDGRPFYDCIAKPFIDGLFKGGRLAPDDSSTKARVAAAAAAAADSVRLGKTVVVAGEVAAPVTSAVLAPIAVPPVVVTRPEIVAASTPAPPARRTTRNAPVKKPAARKAVTRKPAAKKAPARTPVKKPAARSRATTRRTAAMPAAPRPITLRLP